MSAWFAVAMLCVGASDCLVAGAGPLEIAHARELYGQGDFQGALRILNSVGKLNAEGLLLAGQARYRAGDVRAASSDFEKALAANPADSRAALWLGRAYGRRAETGNFLFAPRYAVRARQNFELAVKLDSRNLEAWNDLFAYYLEAPRFLGGGMDKAEAVAERVRGLDSAEYQYDRARLAEKRRQPNLAENHYRKAAELASRDPGRLIDLAEFLESQGRRNEADSIFERANEIAPAAPVVLYERARTYVHSRRRLDDARALLVRYLSLPAGPDDPPRSAALDLFRQLPAGH